MFKPVQKGPNQWPRVQPLGPDISTLNPPPTPPLMPTKFPIHFLPRGLLLTAQTIVQVKEPRSQVTKKFFQP